MDKVTMLKPGILTINIGTGFMDRLQRLINYIGKDLTQEEIDEYSKLFKEGTPSDKYPKEWMTHIFNLTVLLKVVEDAAISQGLTFERDLDISAFKDDIIPE
jgi:hypothetical protein